LQTKKVWRTKKPRQKGAGKKKETQSKS
jgi:hypothetical protein